VIAASVAGPLCHPAVAQQTAGANSQSWYTPITSGAKKIGQAFDPKSSKTNSAPEDDSISLKTQGKPSADLYVAIGRVYQEAGNLPDAEQQYQAALRLSHDEHLGALLAYARLKEDLGQKNEALALYQQAAKTHPKDPSVYNNAGLFYARQGRLDEAVSALTIAIRMAPKNPLFRNNIATVLVDLGRHHEAFAHLRAVHGEAAAYYNMGYLLNKKGQPQAAMQHFAMALRADPSMVVAQRWLEYLERKTTQARLAHHPTAEGLRITTERAAVDATPEAGQLDSPAAQPARGGTALAASESNVSPPPSVAMTTSRLPPVAAERPESRGPSLPGISYDGGESSADQAAPMPPSDTDFAVRRLPLVK
jgi:tetratricopeptide (TPR) repeat protein